MSRSSARRLALPAPVLDAQRRRFRIPSVDVLWRERQLEGLPVGWRSMLGAEWAKRLPVNAWESCERANTWLRETVARLRTAQKAGVEPGDSDGEICRKALREQRLMREWLDAIATRVRRAAAGVNPHRARRACATERAAGQGAAWVERLVIRVQTFAARADMAARGLLAMWPAGRGLSRAGVLRRLVCDRWWRRTLRKAHAFMVEAESIRLGLVRKGAGCYVSDDSMRRRAGQRARNAAALQSVAAVNAEGQAFTLADVAAKGTANGAVRRAELMTRIAGFEVIADECGHPAEFVTVTCPSRMHKWRRGDDSPEPNPAYDGTLPDAAQRYLAGQWAKLRAAAARVGLGLYGFRIAEPHHDGCPHWHLLLWHPARTADGRQVAPLLLELLRRYFLEADSPDEPGAKRYRVKVEPVDRAKGSAVAYVAKYVAKNIDGYAVGVDLYGQPALESSQRVEAWASTWRVRQFQQVGGPPVGVWRELRRVHPFLPPMDAVDAAFEGLAACNRAALSMLQDPATSEVDEAHRIKHGWADYVRVQGGPTAKRRAHALRLWREPTGEATRYGEAAAPVPLGVLAFGVELARVGAVQFPRPRLDRLEAERTTWDIVPRRGVDVAIAVHAAMAADAEAARAMRHEAQRAQAAQWWEDHGSNLQAQGEALGPWTRVNNCTDGEGGGLVAVEFTHRKRGERFRWTQKPNGGVHTMRQPDEPDPPDPAERPY